MGRLEDYINLVSSRRPGSSALALFSSPLQTVGRDISARVPERNDARRRTRAPLEQRPVAPPRQLTGNPNVFSIWNDAEMERPRGSFHTEKSVVFLCTKYHTWRRKHEFDWPLRNTSCKLRAKRAKLARFVRFARLTPSLCRCLPTRNVLCPAAQVAQRTSSSPRAKWNNTHACLRER
jgi:hypothetical protein